MSPIKIKYLLGRNYLNPISRHINLSIFLFTLSHLSRLYQLDQSISALRVVGGIYHFYSNLKEHYVNKQWRP